MDSPPKAPDSPPKAPDSPPKASDSPPKAPDSPPKAPDSPPKAPDSHSPKAPSQDSPSLTPSEIGAEIMAAGASGDLEKLSDIRVKFCQKNLEQICDVYSDFATGRRVLHNVAEAGNVVICDFLIKHFGAFYNIPSFSGDTPMILAAKGGHVKVVKCLIDHGALVQVSNKKGFTALHYAVQQDNMAIVELLLGKNAPMDIHSVDGTVLQIAASRGNVKAVKLLLKKGAEPNAISTSAPSTPLICAIKARSFDCMTCLLKANADKNKFSCGLTPLACAAREKDIRYLKHLLLVKADANLKCTGLLTPIEHAAIAENTEAVRMLFKETAPIATYSKWTVEGILKYNRSGAAKATRDNDKRKLLKVLERVGKTKMDEKDFEKAADLYGQASYVDPNNAKWLVMRSMCNARRGMGVQAVHDAEEAIKRNPQHCPCPKPHYTTGNRGVAWQLFERYHWASITFVLSPDDDKAKDSFRVALFEYFSWLYLTSCPAEMMTFLQNFT